MKASTLTVREMYKAIKGTVGTSWTNKSNGDLRNLCFIGDEDTATNLREAIKNAGYDNVVRFFPAAVYHGTGYVRVLHCPLGC